jgi:RNA polymerase sigma-70 factor, ECF subfamily
MTNSHAVHSPEVDARRQMTNLLEAAIAKLPERFRVVFVLREVEGLSVEETAEALQIPREIVKGRLVRARRKLQQELDSNLRNALAGTFTFAGSDATRLPSACLRRSQRMSASSEVTLSSNLKSARGLPDGEYGLLSLEHIQGK